MSILPQSKGENYNFWANDQQANFIDIDLLTSVTALGQGVPRPSFISRQSFAPNIIPATAVGQAL